MQINGQKRRSSLQVQVILVMEPNHVSFSSHSPTPKLGFAILRKIWLMLIHSLAYKRSHPPLYFSSIWSSHATLSILESNSHAIV